MRLDDQPELSDGSVFKASAEHAIVILMSLRATHFPSEIQVKVLRLLDLNPGMLCLMRNSGRHSIPTRMRRQYQLIANGSNNSDRPAIQDEVLRLSDYFHITKNVSDRVKATDVKQVLIQNKLNMTPTSFFVYMGKRSVKQSSWMIEPIEAI
jgi:hypothetical protein